MPFIVLFNVACEKLGSEIVPFENKPYLNAESCSYTIQDADDDSVTFKFWIAVENLNANAISIEFSSSSKTKKIRLVYDYAYDDYVGSITFDRKDFASIDYYECIAKTPLFTLTLYDEDDNYVDEASYSGFKYSQKPSIEIYNLHNKGTYAYGQDGWDYKTEYSFTCKISGAFFLREKYWYYVGNWSNPGKGSSLSVSDGISTHNMSVLHGANCSEIYMQCRAITHNGYEICSDKSICYGKYNTTTREREIYLVNSSSVEESSYTTRSAMVMDMETMSDIIALGESVLDVRR